MFKPMLAHDWIEAEQKFPVIIQPKIDGVRAVNFDGNITGRSLKSFSNMFTTDKFSRDIFKGFDGEFIVMLNNIYDGLQQSV